MNVLVTGANGLLGRAIVTLLMRRGHSVRALIRPATSIDGLGWDASVDVVRADLRVGRDLEAAFDNIDLLIHLAAAVRGSEDVQFASTVVGTERLLAAMRRSETRDLILASSLSVYDWNAVGPELTEHSPLETDMYRRDGYAIAKIWQERLVREVSRKSGWRLTVFRPGFIWGRGNTSIAGTGQGVGAIYAVLAPMGRPLLTHVDNCADAFVTAAEYRDKAGGQTFNVVDGHTVTNWSYVRRSGSHQRRVPIPYWVGYGLVRAVHSISECSFGGKGKLPNLLIPVRFEARFRPVRCDHRQLRDILGWSPPLNFEDCLRLSAANAQPDGFEPGALRDPAGSRNA